MSTWHEANADYNARAVERTRLLLRRRGLWAQRRWFGDDLSAYRSSIVSDHQFKTLLENDDVAEAQFFATDAEAKPIVNDIVVATRRLEQRSKELEQTYGAPPALVSMAATFGLDTFSADVVALAFANAEDERIGRACAYLNDDLRRAYPTVALSLAVFVPEPGRRAKSRDAFLGRGPLRRFGLIAWPVASEGWSPQTPIALDERIVDYLRGHNRLDRRVSPLVSQCGPPFISDSHADAVDRVENALRTSNKSWPRVNLIGEAEEGTQDVAAAACGRIGLRLFEIEAERLARLDRAERSEAFVLMARDAALLSAAYFVDWPEDEGLRVAASELVREVDAPLFLQSRTRLARASASIPVARLERSAQRSVWDNALRDLGVRFNGEIDRLVQQFDFGPRSIAAVVELARNSAACSGNSTTLSADDLWAACRDYGALDLDPLMARIEPAYTWDDIVLPAATIVQLRDIAIQVEQRARVYETWSFGRKLNRGRGITVLFTGESGTGKTMAAEILAHHLGIALYRIDLSGVVSKYIGETEKNLRRVFDAAERSGALLFFDEADALFGKRSEVRDSHDRYANIQVDYLLQRMEEYSGLAILATNRKSALDPAFLRRLRFVIEFPFPDSEHRRRMWELVFPVAAERGQLDYSALANLQVAGGHIRAIALNAAFLAAGEGVPIEMRHTMRAAAREYRKLERQVAAAEFGAHAEAARR